MSQLGDLEGRKRRRKDDDELSQTVEAQLAKGQAAGILTRQECVCVNSGSPVYIYILAEGETKGTSN